ncbi:hypothetical protein CHS0354_000473 [Potamilus streckersoni]|uniref:ABC transmembrane type-1 domain-containing protein n=1 Tax=Potamilus streckersoni TaxID=2493646 RepID=A0AAE0T704_9BIVA|nr:hypothetical protein CHS0354_000473 [Potamilus streckersoni]
MLSWAFLTESPKEGMTQGGIFPAIFGTLVLVLLMSLATVPVGVITAIYLSEYSMGSIKFAKAIRFAVTNLAGVPSIVFGLFGLGFFIQFIGPMLDKLFSPQGEIIWNKPALIWSAATLAILTLPTVIVSTEEALKNVPKEQREASFVLGATRWQTIWRIVLPRAKSGVLTGTILAISRGAGEVAPILFTGAAFYLPTLPTSLSDQFMHLGYHLYIMATQSSNIQLTLPLQYTTSIVLLVLVFGMNTAAIVVRSKFRKTLKHFG